MTIGIYNIIIGMMPTLLLVFSDGDSWTIKENLGDCIQINILAFWHHVLIITGLLHTRLELATAGNIIRSTSMWSVVHIVSYPTSRFELCYGFSVMP